MRNTLELILVMVSALNVKRKYMVIRIGIKKSTGNSIVKYKSDNSPIILSKFPNAPPVVPLFSR